MSKKLFVLLLILVCLFMGPAPSLWAAPDMQIHVRIEGIHSNLYHKTVSIPFETVLTVQQAIRYINQTDKSLAIQGAEAGFITAIKGEVSGSFGGWDGWLFLVNQKESSSGIENTQLHSGDELILYYGDPYGVGMQFPVMDTSRIKDGILKFTSTDTTFDQDFQPVTAVNPVSGASVHWSYGTETAVYTTDQNGEIKLPLAHREPGSHTVQITKVHASGLPLVLRFSPNQRVECKGEVQTTPVPSSGDTDFPNTGDSSNILSLCILLLSIGVAFFLFRRLQPGRNYEE